MCGRYFIADEDEAEEIKQIIEAVNRKHNGGEGIKLAGEIFPGDKVPVIAASRSQKIMPFPMEWGYSAADGKKLINARSETASRKPTFRDGMLQRRCIVPASWYFEWNKSEPGRPKYAIGDGRHNVIYMAGVYRFEHEKPVFSILTREPAANISFIHNRMPVILPREAVREWLNPQRSGDELLERAVLDVNYRLA